MIKFFLIRHYRLILIILFGAFLRFYNFEEIAHFEFDEQYNSYLVFDLIKNHHFSLVGQMMSFGGMFLGPWHYLFLTPFYILFGLHPRGGYVGEVVIGLFTIYSYYFVGSKLFSRSVGILVSLFRAVIYISIIQDLTIGPAYPGETVALWFIYFLFRLSEGSKRAFIILSFLFGLMFTVHLSVLPLIISWLVVFLILRPIRINFGLYIKSAASFLIPVFPIIIFEARHNFVHIQRFIHTLLSEGRTEGDFVVKAWKVISYNVSSFYKLFDLNLLPAWLGFVVLLFIALILLKNPRLKAVHLPHHRIIFFTTVLVVIIYYIVYPRAVSEYYFIALTPLILLYVSFMLIHISTSRFGKLVAFGFICLVMYSNFQKLYKEHSYQTKFALKQKDQTVKAIVDHQKGKGDFSVSYFMQYGREFGYQYLFTYYNLEPRKEIKPPIYSIVMPRSQVAEKDLSVYFSDIGVIFPEDEPEQNSHF